MAAPVGSRVMLKVLIIGEAAVGKTSLLLRFTDPTWDVHSVPPSQGVDTVSFECQVDGRDVKIQLWDTAGQEKFRVITSTFYKGAHGVLVVYDTTSRESFETVESWLGEVGRYCQGKVGRVVVANKVDLSAERAVPRAEGEQLVGSLGADLHHVETSIFDAESVQRAFMQVARLALAEHDAQQQAILARQSSATGSATALKPGTVFKVPESPTASPATQQRATTTTGDKQKRGCCSLL